GMKRSAEGIATAATRARAEAEAAQSRALGYGITGGIGLITVHLATGLLGTILLSRRFRRWRADRRLGHRLPALRTLFAGGLTLGSAALSSWRFAFPDPPAWLSSFPSSPDIYNACARWLDSAFKAAADGLGGIFRAIAAAINAIL